MTASTYISAEIDSYTFSEEEIKNECVRVKGDFRGRVSKNSRQSQRKTEARKYWSKLTSEERSELLGRSWKPNSPLPVKEYIAYSEFARLANSLLQVPRMPSEASDALVQSKHESRCKECFLELGYSELSFSKEGNVTIEGQVFSNKDLKQRYIDGEGRFSLPGVKGKYFIHHLFGKQNKPDFVAIDGEIGVGIEAKSAATQIMTNSGIFAANSIVVCATDTGQRIARGISVMTPEVREVWEWLRLQVAPAYETANRMLNAIPPRRNPWRFDAYDRPMATPRNNVITCQYADELEQEAFEYLNGLG